MKSYSRDDTCQKKQSNYAIHYLHLMHHIHKQTKMSLSLIHYKVGYIDIYIYRYIYIYRVRLMCALRAHIKLSIFENIFSGIEKTIITFSIFEKNISKYRKLNVCP